MVFNKIRFLRSLRYKMRRLLGMHCSNESLPTSDAEQTPSSWPLLVYGGLALAAPYLLWRAIGGGDHQVPKWDPDIDDCLVAEVVTSFEPKSSGQVPLRRNGQRVLVAPREMQPRVRGWLLCRPEGEVEMGMAPAECLKILGRRKKKKSVMPDVTTTEADNLQMSNSSQSHHFE